MNKKYLDPAYNSLAANTDTNRVKPAIIIDPVTGEPMQLGGNTPPPPAQDISYSKVSEVTVGGITNGDTVGPDVKAALDQLLSVPYSAPTLSSLSYVGIGNQELGYKLTGLKSFTFTKQEGGARGTFNANTLLLKQGGATLVSGLPVTSPISQTVTDVTNNVAGASVTFTIQAIDEKGNTISTTATTSWIGEVYYGVADDKTLPEITEAWVKATLTKYPRNNHAGPFTITIGAGKRFYYIYPSSLGVKLFNTTVAPETLSNLSPSGLEMKTSQQVANGLSGIDYAINKNEQSGIGTITYTLVNP